MHFGKHYLLACCAVVVALQACGGGGGSSVDAPVPPVVVPPRGSEWSQPQFSKVSFDNRTAVTAHADNCGGISFLGTTATSYLAQRFSPSSGWQAAVPFIVNGNSVQGVVQRIDVGSVPYVFYRDASNWYSVRFDCAQNSWQQSTAFAVDYRKVSGQADVAIEVNFSETFDHAILAAKASADGNFVQLTEWRGNAWSPSVSLPMYDRVYIPTDRRVAIEGVSVVRAKGGEVAAISYGGGARYIAARDTSLQYFRPITPLENCLGRLCMGVPSYFLGGLQPDGSATVSLFGAGAVSNDWYRVDPAGLTSLWGSGRASASTDPALSLVRSDGVPLWWASGSRDPAQAKTSVGSIVENGVQANWSQAFDYERMECFTAGCRVFSQPDPSHLVTIVDGFANLTPTKTSYLTISDRSARDNWIGSYALPLTQLLAQAPGPQVPAQFAWPANGMVEVLKFHAADPRQIVAAVVNRKSSGVTPFVLWK